MFCIRIYPRSSVIQRRYFSCVNLTHQVRVIRPCTTPLCVRQVYHKIMKKRIFETRGPVNPSRNYVVPRQTEIAELVARIEQGRYIVIFAPRQTGKTTFFRWTLDALDNTYFPIQLDFEAYKNISLEAFYAYLHQDICEEILNTLQKRQSVPSKSLLQFLEKSAIADHVAMIGFFKNLGNHLKNQKIVIVIDEFQSS